MSRLETSGSNFREQIISRNLYTPNDIYDISNPKVIQALNSISRLLRPGNAFDFSNTVIGRVIGPQTPITTIGRRALFNLYTEQVKSTIIRKKAPLINFNNLLRNPSEFITNNVDFSITKEDSNTIESKIFDVLRYSGVNRLENPISIESNISEEKNFNTNALSKFYLKNTGKGQRQTLINNLNNNIFSNNLNDIFEIDNTAYKTLLISKKTNTSFLNKSFDVETDINSIGFAVSRTLYERHFRIRYNSNTYLRTDDNGIPNLNKKAIEEDFGSNYIISKNFKDIDLFNDNDIVTLNDSTRIFTWGKDQPDTINSSKGILGYTANLFNILNNRNNAPFNKTVGSIEINGEKYYNGIRYGINDENENPIVGGERTYHLNNQMDRISKTIKPFGYSDKSKKNSQVYQKSPLYNRPIPKIVLDRVKSYILKGEDGKDITKYTPVNNNVMFTIENLAHSNDTIPDVNERGPHGGRILWFAPMIESFNESSTPNINTTNFLGRGEPVYTYANTERKLTINFLMVVDHVDELVGVTNFNQFQDRLYNLRIKEKIEEQKTDVSGTKINKDIENITETIKSLEKIIIPFEYEDFTEVFFYFEHNIRNVSQTISSGYEKDGLNREFIDEIVVLSNKLQEYVEKNPNGRFNITLKGYASAAGNIPYNQKLSEDRANSLKEYLQSLWIGTKFINNIDFEIESFGETQAIGQSVQDGINFESASAKDTLVAKKDRKVSILNVELVTGTEEIEIELEIPNIDQNILIDSKSELDDLNDTKNNTKKINDNGSIKEFNDEYDPDYPVDTFSSIKGNKYKNGLIVYTPYELYKRLTFLNQCVRQGSTIEDSKTNTTSNAVFGRPPFIIFRLGDMYNTKAIITSLTFDFENNLPWDINPEGFGVQKMGCRVALSMNLIGGSSVDSTKENPISHILNAESRRFYANSRFEPDAGTNDKLDKEEK